MDTITGLLEAHSLEESILKFSLPPPPLPSRKEANQAFHVYKNKLMKLSSHELPARIPIKDSNHIRLFSDVLLNHPNAEKKIGSSGVKFFFVQRIKADGEDVCCLHVRRIDGTEEDFSYPKCYGKRSWKDEGKRFDSTTGKLILRRLDED